MCWSVTRSSRGATANPSRRVCSDSSWAATSATEELSALSTWYSIARRSYSATSRRSSKWSMKVRRPCSVGKRPADVCGCCTMPSAASSASVARIVADESGFTSRWEMCLEPIGAASPT
jgi:hypothetical protein